MLDAHSGKYYGKLTSAPPFRRLRPGSLLDDLGGKLVMGAGRCLKKLGALPTDQRCKPVDGGNPGADVVSPDIPGAQGSWAYR